jgi:Ca2+-binding RTX toxin-like protein
MDDVIEEAAGAGSDEVRTAMGSRTDYSLMYTLADGVEKFTGTSTGSQGVHLNALDNVAIMGGGNDLVALHQGGNDYVDGGAGNDFLYFGATFDALDVVIGGAGIDTVGLIGSYDLVLGTQSLQGVERLAIYTSGDPAAPNNYVLTTVDGNVAAGGELMVAGQSLTANERLVFNGQAESDGSFNIRGGKGSDALTGGAMADRIYGNFGADTLKGGAGADMFDYFDSTDSTAAACDTILDFSAEDWINLWEIDADGNAANGNSAFSWIGAGAFGGIAGQLRATQVQGGGFLVEADSNGDAVADLVILVQTTAGHILGAGDFNL